MNKFFIKVGIFFIGAIVGAVIVFFLKPKPPVIDPANIPTKLEYVEAKPDTVFLTEIKVIKGIDYKKRLEQAEKLVKQLKNQEPEIIETSPGLLWQKSVKEFTWDKDLKFAREKDWFVKADITAFSLMPIELYGADIEVRWDSYFDKYYMPKIEKQLYNKGIYGVLVGAATVGAFLYEDPYLAGGAILMCADFTFDLGVGKFIFNLF